MTEILTTANYMSESTEDLIRKAEQILAGLPVISPIETTDFETNYTGSTDVRPVDIIDVRPADIVDIGPILERERTRIHLPRIPKIPSNINKYISSLSPACYRIVVKSVANSITVTDKSIVICTGSAIGTCPTIIPASCPIDVLPTDYVNMVAIINAASAQSGVVIRFEYLLDDIPTHTDATFSLVTGPNIVHCFDPNKQYPAGKSLTLYDVKIM